MSANLSFPCDPRFASTIRDALATAVTGIGLDERRVAAVVALVDRFLAENVTKPADSEISIQLSATRLRLAAAGRSLTVDL